MSRDSVLRSDWSIDEEELGHNIVSHIVSDLIVCIMSVSAGFIILFYCTNA